MLVPRPRTYPQYEAGESDHKDKVLRLSDPPLATKSMVIPYYGCPNKTNSHSNCSEDVLVDGQTVMKDLLVNENKGMLWITAISVFLVSAFFWKIKKSSRR